MIDLAIMKTEKLSKITLKEHSTGDRQSLLMGKFNSAGVVFRKFLPIGESANVFEYFV